MHQRIIWFTVGMIGLVVVCVGAAVFIRNRALDQPAAASVEDISVPAANTKPVKIDDNLETGLSTIYYNGSKLTDIPNGWGKFTIGLFRLTDRHAYIYSCLKESKGYLLFGVCPRRIFQLSLATGEQRNVIDGYRSYNDLAEDVSPDESVVVLGRSEGQDSAMVLSVVVREIGSEEEIVFPLSAPEYQQLGDMHFSPDGNRIAYAVARGIPGNEVGAVYMLDIDSGEQSLVATTSKPNSYFRVQGWKDNITPEYSQQDASALAP